MTSHSHCGGPQFESGQAHSEGKMNFEKLREEQLKLSRKTILKDQTKEYLTFGGADCAFSGNRIVAGIVLCDKDLNVIEKQYAVLR